MGVYDSKIKTAKRLIEKYGQKVVWKIATNTADTEKPWIVNSINKNSKDVIICFLPANRAGFESLGLKQPDDMPTTAVLGLMAQVDFSPTLKDEVVRDGKTLTIEYIDIIAPNGTPILYTMIFK